MKRWPTCFLRCLLWACLFAGSRPAEGFFQKSAPYTSPAKLASHAAEAKYNLAEKEQALAAHEREIGKVREEMDRTHRLYLDGHVTPQGFGDFYKPAKQQASSLRYHRRRVGHFGGRASWRLFSNRLRFVSIRVHTWLPFLP